MVFKQKQLKKKNANGTRDRPPPLFMANAIKISILLFEYFIQDIREHQFDPENKFASKSLSVASIPDFASAWREQVGR